MQHFELWPSSPLEQEGPSVATRRPRCGYLESHTADPGRFEESRHRFPHNLSILALVFFVFARVLV